MNKLKKLQFIEAPISEMDQEMMDEILAGWLCTSFAPTNNCLTNGCASFKEKTECTQDGYTGNFCEKYYYNGVCYEKIVVGSGL